MPSILDLEQKLNQIKNKDIETYNIIKDIYEINFGTGRMKIPTGLKDKFSALFPTNLEGNSVNHLLNQKIVKIYNKWTGEGALFNHLRSFRPGMKKDDVDAIQAEIKKVIENSKNNCDFCKPLTSTPADIFGRVRGMHSVTASNIAKYDAWSSLVIFKNHDPLKFNLGEFSDYLRTAFTWFERVHQEDESYNIPFLIWNCLYKAGASLVHGHAQILMTKGYSYAKVQKLKDASLNYQKSTQRDYFQDWYRIHDQLGLAWTAGEVQLVANLTPTKEKEISIISQESPVKNPLLLQTIYKTLRCWIDVLGVHSFNLSLSCPPLDGNEEMPYLINIVDRGSILKPTADMGGMELYGSTVVADDPYNLMQTLKNYW